MKANNRLPDRQAVPKGRLYFLWHPGTKDIFSGYGLTVQPGRKDHLIGLLMVDRPQKVDPVWLTEIERRFGGYVLYMMTVTGERGIACQMQIEPASFPYLRRELPDYLGATVRQGFRQILSPLVQQPPRPRLKVRWDENLHLWMSEFQPTKQSDIATSNPLVRKDVGKGERHLMNDQTVSRNGSQKTPKKALFPLGQVVATPGALEALEDAGQEADEFLYKHVTGEWGDLDEEDKQQNDLAVKEGSRILSAYQTNKGVRIWVITEWDRSVTTLLLPSEY